MILIPKYTDLYTSQPLTARFGLGGEFRCILRDEMGRAVYDTGWFHNLLTDLGLNSGLKNGSWYINCHLGTSSTAPAFTDTTLGGWLANHSTSVSGVGVANAGSPNYEGTATRGWRFNAGVATGTIQEIGLGPNTSNINMNVRALISPSIVKAANQVLDVFYKVTIYPFIGADDVGVVSIGGEDYDYTGRMSNVGETGTAFEAWGPNYTSTVHTAYSGSIGTITGVPGGSTDASDSASEINSGANAQRDVRVSYGLDSANFGGAGPRSTKMRINMGTGIADEPGYQVEFSRVSDSANIQKDNTKTLTVDYRVTWARH